MKGLAMTTTHTASAAPTSRIALVTGGSRGLGRSAALQLAAAGWDLILTYRSNAAEAAAVIQAIEQQGRRAVALQLDAGDARAFGDFAAQVRRELAQRWQRERFDVLLNNAGVGAHASFEQTTEAQLDELYAVHVKGPFLLTQRLLPLLADGGRIFNVSSGLTRMTLPGYAAYASMKTAVETLTRYQARELGARGITVNTIAPGAIETDFGGGAVRDNAALNRQIAEGTALGRVGLPDDIGALVATLVQPGLHWVTGQRIEASGGQFL
jgi:NAD(P)-dependent dehydrogenase (short-subunit alcohol dehydrogenase family)